MCCSPWSRKESDMTEQLDGSDSPSGLSQMVARMVKDLPALQETLVRFLDREDPLEKEMATHSNILVWRIPGEEPGRLQSMGSQTVRHD